MDTPHLDLLNFEEPIYKSCKYILTSPRSLKACRRAGVKPVELLRKKIEDFEKSLTSKNDVLKEFENFERERQRKLQLCHSIRSFLIRREQCKLASHEEVNNNIPDVKSLHKQNKNEDGEVITLPPIDDFYNQDIINQSPIVEVFPLIDETNEENCNHRFPQVSNDENNSDSYKSGHSKKRMVRINDKKGSRTNKSRSKDSKKMPKITQFFQSWPFLTGSNKDYIVDPDYRIQKFEQVIRNSVERDLKQQKAEMIQKELEIGLERWQDRILLDQWAASERAKEQANRGLEVKLQRLSEKNRMKQILHEQNLNKVKEAEDNKVEDLRRSIQYKNMKIHTLHKERERIILESKSRAQSVSDLRQQIRNIMTPETFDQKVSKYAPECRILNFPIMGPDSMLTTHFYLG